MKLKNGLLIASVLLIGAVNAQENPPVPPPPPPPAPGPPQPVVKPDIIDFPDVEAEFPGGSEELKKYIQNNVEYPEVSRQLGDQGRVYVTFIVEVDGSVSSVDVMRGGVTPELNREAKRLVRTMPKWKPGEVKGKAVRCRCRLPITFVLTNPKEKKKKK